MISDKELQEAARRYEKALLAGLPEPEECPAVFSPAFERKMKKLIFRVDHPVRFWMRLLLPVLVVLCGGIGFLAGFLTARGRIREFAVMRCLGVKRRRIFSLVLWEHALLTAAGALAGLLTLPLAGELSGGLLLRTALLLAAYLAGAAAAVGGITRVNVMKLLREEE